MFDSFDSDTICDTSSVNIDYDYPSNININDPYGDLSFSERRAFLRDKDGNIILDEQVIFSDNFDDNSVNIITDKYLANHAKFKETDIRHMFNRVSETIGEFGSEQGYFNDDVEKNDFINRLKYYQSHQYFAFNSPVYFNIGIDKNPQCSACYICNIEDNMISIMDWIKTESLIFRKGSGSGVNGSKLRSSKEHVGGGTGYASGPVSFWKGSDVFAGVVKSGGILRRAAKMFRLDIDHPDIIEAMSVKEREEEKMRILERNGIRARKGAELSDEVFFQNTNFSLGITDKFMHAAENGEAWYTKAVLTKEPMDKYDARQLLMDISKKTWSVADPGVQFHDNINFMNPLPAEGEIESSNPCSEFFSQPNRSCNLASLNLVKFFELKDGVIIFKYGIFKDVIHTVIKAQDMLIDSASYPNDDIANGTKYSRDLGLGYSNLGGLLMILGYPYDSDIARTLTSCITSLMTAEANHGSIDTCKRVGLSDWAKRPENIESVARIHRIFKANTTKISASKFNDIKHLAIDRWKDVISSPICPRQAQTTLLAPTGTISYLMNSSTFGCEPDFSLITFKKLSGNDGATITLINKLVPIALTNLGYSADIVEQICNEVISGTPIENSKYIKQEHVAIFDTAMVPAGGKRFISVDGHINMMAAIQPFINGAISKTLNCPNNTTVEDIYNIYFKCWRLKLKAIAIYRDGSKLSQPLTVTKEGQQEDLDYQPVRRRMPVERDAKINKFAINGSSGEIVGYLTRGLYPSGDLGEIFIELAKEGSTIRGLLGCIVTLSSIAIQYNVPLYELVEKMIYRRFEPSGWVKGDDNIKSCSSIVDYIFKYLAYNHLTDEQLISLGLKTIDDTKDETPDKIKTPAVMSSSVCPKCNSQLFILGRCEFCRSCSWTGGSCS
jgi:ribonucleoside-diphosphate reductase alpha chain